MIYIFTGPTISKSEGAQILEAHYLPPVAQGDLYRVSLLKPQVIGIIDGYFERIPAVWHKEILWAMQQGVHVYGSASMGALRAAELTAFGMVGVGKIFEDYHRGILEDDDEVALLHGPELVNYQAVSEPMVNIRATLEKALDCKIITAETKERLVQIGKTLFYGDRSYEVIMEEGRKTGLSKSQLIELQTWLSNYKINQKQEDARAMLALIKQTHHKSIESKHIQYHLEQTFWWEGLQKRAKDM